MAKTMARKTLTEGPVREMRSSSAGVPMLSRLLTPPIG
jgi:hypothetical protein